MLHLLQLIYGSLLLPLSAPLSSSLAHWSRLIYTGQVTPYFLWWLKEQECAHTTPLTFFISFGTVEVFCILHRRIRMLMTYIALWWAGWFFCLPLKTFVSIFVEIGLYNLKNVLFLRVSSRELSIITTNWSCGSTSIPLLSYLRG